MRIRQSKTDALSEGVLLYLGEEAMQPGFGRRRRLAWATDSQATRRGLGWPLTLVGDGAELPAVMVAGRWEVASDGQPVRRGDSGGPWGGGQIPQEGPARGRSI